MKLVLLPLLAALIIAVDVTPARAGEVIPITAEKELQVVVHDNVAPRRRDSWTSFQRERDRYLEFESAMKEAIKAAGYAGTVKITEFAANIPPAEQRLNVYIYRWETGLESFGVSFTAEFTMEAVLQVGDREYELGTFSARESHMALSGPQPEDYRPAARRAIDQMIEFYRHALAASQPKK